MKHLLISLICITVAFALTACGSSKNDEPPVVENKPYIQQSEQIPKEKPADLPPYEEIGTVQHQTLFEFDCTALTDTWTQSGTHTVFTCSYGDTDHRAMMDMDYRMNRDTLVKGAKLRVRCRLGSVGADGTPWFDVLSYTVES